MSQHQKRLEHLKRRRAAGLTQKELGEEFEMSRSQAGHYTRQKDKPKKEED